MATTVTVRAIVPDAESAEGVNVRFVNTFENLIYTYTFGEGESEYVFEEFRKGNYEVTVTLADYTCSYANTPVSIWGETEIVAELEEIFKPVDAVTASVTGYVMWTNMAPAPDRTFERYMVTLNGALVAETTENFINLEEVEALEEHQQYTVGVAVVYSTGMSPYVTKSFTYLGCAGVEMQVTDLSADNEDLFVTLAWNGASPSPVTPVTPVVPTGGWTEGFESGLPTGWNVVDANNDGYTWCLTSAIPTTWTYYASLTLDWYRTGSNAICSGSYINGVGALTPDEYLVTPAQAITAGTTFSFWAAATDGNYPADHFGVFVSDNGTSNWTMVNEWTLTGKSGAVNGGRASREGNGAKLGTWYNYSVDLSSYAGTKYIAIRHFNCNDQYIMCVDDIEFATPSKLGEGTIANAGKGFGGEANMTRDWHFYDSGTNSDAIGLTSGGGFYWGIMLPAGTYSEGNAVTKIAYFDYAAHNGQFMIYNGGTSAPQTLLYTQNYTVTGSNTYIEIELDEPVEVDNTQTLWLVMHNNNGQYVAAIDETYAGVANGSCISTDGSTWYNTVSAASGGQLDGNWNLRIMVDAGGPAPIPGGVQPNKFNVFLDGELVGATASNSIQVEAPDYEAHVYRVVYVDANYGMSCPAEITYSCGQIVAENEVVNTIYPNPTSGDLHINATAMKHISIINTMGQVVYNQDVNTDETVIDMAKFESGVYMVNIITENGSSVKRVTVTK
jgi:hypothetical protein